MNETWIVASLFILWIVVLIQGLAIIALIKKWKGTQPEQQVKFDINSVGLTIGDTFPPIEGLVAVSGSSFSVREGTSSLILLTAEGCSVCHSLLSQLGNFGSNLPFDFWILHAGSRDQATALQEHSLNPAQVVPIDFEAVRARLRSVVFPLCYLLNSEGQVAGKWLVDSRDRLSEIVHRNAPVG